MHSKMKNGIEAIINVLTQGVASGRLPGVLEKLHKESIDNVINMEKRYSRGRKVGSFLAFGGSAVCIYNLFVPHGDIGLIALFVFIFGFLIEMIYLEKKARLFRKFIDSVVSYEKARNAEKMLAKMREESLEREAKIKAEEEARQKEHADHKKPLRSKQAR